MKRGILTNFVVNRLVASYLVPKRIRWRIYRIFGMDVLNSRVAPHCFFGGDGIHIGINTFINYNNFFDLSAEIFIGDNVRIGMGSTFVTGTHKIGNPDMRGGDPVTAPIKIGNGCWIGANVTILPGVTIEEGSVIAAGAVVMSNVPTNCLFGGVPAKLLKKYELESGE